MSHHDISPTVLRFILLDAINTIGGGSYRIPVIYEVAKPSPVIKASSEVRVWKPRPLFIDKRVVKRRPWLTFLADTWPVGLLLLGCALGVANLVTN
jgi:hypothetical protein